MPAAAPPPLHAAASSCCHCAVDTLATHLMGPDIFGRENV